MVNEYGPELARVLIHGIAGNEPRSNLDVLGEPLKKMVFAQPRAKSWLTHALEAEDFPSQKVTPDQKRVWLNKVMR